MHKTVNERDDVESFARELQRHNDESAPLFTQIAALRAKRRETPTSQPLTHTPLRPTIGVPASFVRSQCGKWPFEAADAAVIRAIVDAGGDPYLFPCRPLRQQEDHFEAVWQVLRRCDGIVLPGGEADVHPGWYHETLHPISVSPLWWEDWWKIHLAQLATLLGLPFLGICQGLQYWVVAQGGTVYQHIRSQYQGAGKHAARGTLHIDRWQFNAMRLLPVAGSALLQCADQAVAIWGACMHHQAVRDVPNGLAVTAIEMDGLIGAIERLDGFFGVGLQWHPEQRHIYATQPYARNIFQALILAARHQAYRQRTEVDMLYEDVKTYLQGVRDSEARLSPPPLVAADDLLSDLETRTEIAVPSAAQAALWLRDQEHGRLVSQWREVL